MYTGYSPLCSICPPAPFLIPPPWACLIRQPSRGSGSSGPRGSSPGARPCTGEEQGSMGGTEEKDQGWRQGPAAQLKSRHSTALLLLRQQAPLVGTELHPDRPVCPGRSAPWSRCSRRPRGTARRSRRAARATTCPRSCGTSTSWATWPLIQARAPSFVTRLTTVRYSTAS